MPGFVPVEMKQALNPISKHVDNFAAAPIAARGRLSDYSEMGSRFAASPFVSRGEFATIIRNRPSAAANTFRIAVLLSGERGAIAAPSLARRDEGCFGISRVLQPGDSGLGVASELFINMAKMNPSFFVYPVGEVFLLEKQIEPSSYRSASCCSF